MFGNLVKHQGCPRNGKVNFILLSPDTKPLDDTCSLSEYRGVAEGFTGWSSFAENRYRNVLREK